MRLAALAGALLVALPLSAIPTAYPVTPGGKNVAEFHAEDTYDAFDGRTKKVSGTITADPANPAASIVELSVDMASLDTGVSLRNHEMRERYLETPKYPNATFRSVSVSRPPSVSPNQPVDMSVTGDFTLHGITRRMTIPVRVVLIPDGRIHATSMFNVHMPDFGINVPKNILVTVEDNIPVRLDVWGGGK